MSKKSLSHDHHELTSKTYYDLIAHKFNHTWDSFLSGFFRRTVMKHAVIADGSSVLDIGSADGRLLAMLDKRSDFQGVGLDISPQMVNRATSLHPNYKFFIGSAQALPFPDQSFDTITCSASFHHFPDPKEALSEMYRVLKPGGQVLIAEIRIPIYDLRRAYNRHNQQHSQEGDVKVYGGQELRDLFQAANFQITDQKYQWQIQYFQLKKDSFIFN